jgi:protein disulfide-isomerase A6
VVVCAVRWCGHCKSLVPEYKKAASSLKGVAKVGAVDMTKHESFGGQYGIKGFPTIKLFIGNKDKPVDYGGERTASAMADFVKREVKAQEAVKGGKGGSKSSSSSSSEKKSGSKAAGGKVVEVTESTFQELVLDSDDLWLVEFFAPSAQRTPQHGRQRG